MDFKDIVAQTTQPLDPARAPKRETPMADAENAILAGEYEFPAGKDVNVIGPGGESYSLPSEQITEALKQGYRLEAPNEQAKREFRKEYKGIKGDAIVAMGQFADEFLGGVPEAAFDALASRDAFDKKEALKADHELANTLGGVGGFGASVIGGGPLGKLFTGAEKVGAKAADAVARSLAKRGISKGSANLGAQIIAKTAENATKLGIEGAISTAPLAITESALGDPEAGAETLMMGGGLGIGLGILSGPTSVLFKRANEAAKKAVEKRFGTVADDVAKAGGDFKNAAPSVDNAGDGTLLGDAAADGASEGILSTLRKKLGKIKGNAGEIKDAAGKLGLDVMEEQLAADKVVQDYASALSKKATIPGIKKAQAIQKRFDAYDKVIKNALKIGDEAPSKFAVGEEAKISILKSAKDSIDAEGAIFNELRQSYDDIILDEKPIKQVLGNIKKIADESIDDQAASIARNVARKIEEGRVKSLNDLFELRTQIRDLYSPTSTGSVKKTISELVEKLNLQEERTIDRAIKSRIESASVPGGATLEEATRLQGLYDDMQGAKKRWSELARNLEDAGDALGLGSINSPRDFIRKVDNLTAEQLASKLIPKNDVAALKALKERFPEQFEAVASLEKSRLLDQVISDDRVSPRKFITQYKKMTPEFRDTLFDAETKSMLDAVRVDLESLPFNVNPSGTAQTLSYMNLLSKDNLLSPSFYMENIADLASNAALKKVVNVDDLVRTEKQMVEVNKKLNQIPTVIKSLKAKIPAKSAASLGASSRLLGEDSEDRRKSFEKLKEKLEQVAVDPRLIVDNLSTETEGYSSAAPNITNKFIEKNSQALNYLYQEMPKPANVSTPFYRKEFRPSDTDLAKFERKLSVVMDPFVVLETLKDGSLTKDHMDALLVNYPLLAQAMRGRIMDDFTENETKLPYQSRIKLSLFMGFDIDGTTTPQSVAMYQNAFAFATTVDQNGDGLSQTGLNQMEPSEDMWTQSQMGQMKT